MIAVTSGLALLCFPSCKKTSTGQGGAAPEVEEKDQSYVLYKEGYSLPVGTVITESSVNMMKDARLEVAMMGQVSKGTMESKGETVEVTTYDSESQRTLFFEKDQEIKKSEMDGKEEPEQTLTKPMQGKSVVLSKDDQGVWSAKLKEGEPTEEIQKKIDKLVKSQNTEEGAEMYGAAPRKIGDTWEVDIAKLSAFDVADGDSEGTIKLTFQSVEEFEGMRCAVLSADLEMVSELDQGMKMKLKGTVTVLRSLDYFEDLKMKVEADVKLTGAIGNGAGSVKMTGKMVADGKKMLKLP